MKAGFIKNTKAFNMWVRTRHIAAEMQNLLNKVLKIKISSIHKDSAPSGMRRHKENVKKLKEIIRTTYKYVFFLPMSQLQQSPREKRFRKKL